MSKGALILGGSLAGIQAAIDLADAGIHVHLVEEAPFLVNTGGPGLPRELLNTRLLEVARHPNVEVWTKTHLNRVEKLPGRLRVELRRHPRYVDLSRCTACGDCVETCPVTVPGTNHKAIYLDGQPGCMAIDKEGKPPCANTCPGGIHVQGYVALVAQGRFQEAIDLVRAAIPFPGICGRVCTHPCEFNCRRAEFDKPVAVRLLKRFVADWELSQGKRKPARVPERAADRAEEVAIVGAGPGGMAVADRLARLGYGVTVFEKLPVIGGMMAAGIPEYRLPREVIAREYKQIQDLGVEIRLNTSIGPDGDYSLDDLFEQGYGAVCLAVGAHRSLNLRIPGEDLPGVVHGIELLRAINLSQRVDEPKYKADLKKMLRRGKSTRVAILGGGNTAMDVARSLRRLGVKEVRILYRRTRAEMPAMPEEIEDAEKEGVVIEYLVSPVRVLGDENGVNGLECIRMKLGEPDASGRRRPVAIAGSEFVADLDVVVLAIGQAPDFSFLGESHEIAITRDERINVADVSFMTSRLGVFAVGDAVTSDKMVVIEAIGMGKQAAASIDAYLRGELPHEIAVDDREVPIARRDLSDSSLQPIERTPAPTIPLKERMTTFSEMELGYTQEQAIAEAQRCLVCGPCSECQACVKVCKSGAIVHEQHEQYLSLDVGILIQADKEEHIPAHILTERDGFFRLPPTDMLGASAAAASALARLSSETHILRLLPMPTPSIEQTRLGVFLCECGDEIAGVVDLEAVQKNAAALPGVVYTERIQFSCLPAGLEAIQAAVRSQALDRAVLAACSCCGVDQVCYSCTYQRLRCKQNLGLYTPAPSLESTAETMDIPPAQRARFEFVNLREQCAWPHTHDPHTATAKAIALVSGAAARAQLTPAPAGKFTQARSALVVGRGAAGTVCRKYLEKQKIAVACLKGAPQEIRRTGGQYLAVKDDENWLASAIVLAPRDLSEAGQLQAAFGRAELQPRIKPAWGGVQTHRPGVFFCDPSQPPQANGAAAAARLAAWLGRVEAHPPFAAVVQPERCRACGTCIQTCEFGAPCLVTEADPTHAWIDPAVCTACGACAAACPSGAIIPGYSADTEIQVALTAMAG